MSLEKRLALLEKKINLIYYFLCEDDDDLPKNIMSMFCKYCGRRIRNWEIDTTNKKINGTTGVHYSCLTCGDSTNWFSTDDIELLDKPSSNLVGDSSDSESD